MKHIILTVSLVLIISSLAFAQKTAPKSVDLQSDTQIAAQLQGTLDVKKARPGDQVVLKTTQAVKQNGQVVVQKGSKLIGHVTEVQQKAKGDASSKIGVLFDRLQNSGGGMMPITASIMSITQARTAASVADDMQMDTSAMSSTRTTTSSSGGGGGLLGGVGNTVGGVVNTATTTTGNVLNTTTQTVGNVAGSTMNTVGTNIRGLSVSQSSNASAQGGSTLSLSGGNLKLDQGTTFNLMVSQSASVGRN